MFFFSSLSGVDVTVTSLAAARALWWQKNTGNKWRETGKIQGIREKIYCCAFGCQNWNGNNFDIILLSTNKYHIYHSLALLGAARCRKPALAGAILLAGMGCFCGPLYHQALTNDPSFSKLAPIGGSLLIVGWAAMAL
uniref:Transmembrane protein 256 n=1 Tax=Sinocyclocheilus anshuiensis TaxID=1608454 RepID=A0A671NKT1_9TELE